MQFIDPFQLLQLNVSDPQAVDAAMLAEVEGKLAGELATADGALTVNGRSVLVADAKALIAAMQDTNARRHFWEMRSIAGLIPYLEGQPNANPTLLINKCKEKAPEFFEFASRWLADRLNAHLATAIQAARWPEAMQVCRAGSSLLGGYDVQATAAGRKYFEELLMKVEQVLAAGKSEQTQEKIRPLHQPAMLGTLNAMPDSNQELRDAIAMALGRLIAKIAGSKDVRLWSYGVYTDISKIRTSPAIEEKLKTVDALVKRDSGVAAKEANESNQKQIIQIVGLVILVSVLITVIRFAIRHM